MRWGATTTCYELYANFLASRPLVCNEGRAITTMYCTVVGCVM